MRKEEQYLTSNMHKEMLKLIRRTIIFNGGKCMKKQVKKWLTLIMAFALILGSVKYSPLSAEATEVSRSDSEDIVTVTDGDADESDVINEEDVIDEGDVPEDIETVSGDMAPVLEEVQMFSLEENARAAGTNLVDSIETNSEDDKRVYAVTTATEGENVFKEIKPRWGGSDTYAEDSTNKTVELQGTTETLFALNESDYIDASKVESVTFAMSNHSGQWTYKVVIDNNAANDVVKYNVKEDTLTLPIAVTEGKITGIVIMGGSGFTGTFDGIVVDLTDKVLVEKTYTFKELGEPSGYGYSGADDNTPPVLDGSGAVTIEFKQNYQEIRYKIPEKVADNIRKVTLNNSVAGKDDLYLKLLNASETTEADAPVLSVSSKVTGYTQLAIMQNGSNLTHTLNSVTFLVREDESIDPTGNTTPSGDGVDDISLPATAENMRNCYNNPGASAVGPDANGSYQLAMDGAWQQCVFELKEPIDLSNCKKVTFAIPSKTGDVMFKMYESMDGEWWNNAVADGNGTSFTVTSDKTIQYIAVSSKGNAASCTFDGVMFEMEEPTETYTITVYASALKHDWSDTGITNTLGTDNRLKIDFGVQNRDSRYDLTNGSGEALSIDLANVEKVTFNVCNQEGRHNISLNKDGTKVGDSIQNQIGSAFTMVPTAKTGTINEVVFQAAGWDYGPGNTLTIESVVFTMKKTADDQENISYGVAPTEIEVDPTENITPEVKTDLDKRFTHKDGGLTPQDPTRCTSQEVEKVALSFSGAWDTIRFDLPEVIDLAKCKSVTFAISEQTAPFTLKLFDENGEEIGADGTVTQYDANKKLNVKNFSGREETVKSVGIMLHENTVKNGNYSTYTCVFDGVLFEMMEEAEKTHDLIYTCDDLAVVDSKNGGSCEKVDGKYVMTFPQLNAETSFKLPDIINMENCSRVEITVSGQTGPANFYFEYNGSNKQTEYYKKSDANGNAVYAIAAKTTEGVNEVRIQCGGEGSQGQEYVPGSGITLEKITFVMKGSDSDTTNDFLKEEEAGPDKVEGTPNQTPEGEYSYQAADSTVRVATAGVPGIEYAPTTTNQYQITFVKQYNELRLTLPEAIDLLQCKSVTFVVSAQSGPVAFRLYNEDAQEIKSMYNRQNTDGSPLYTEELSSTEKVKYVAILLDQNNPGTTCTFDGVYFDIDTNATTETYTVTYPAHELTLKSSEAASCELENGNWMIKFSNMDQNVNFKLPASVNMEKCVNMIVTVATQNGPMNFNVSLDNSKLKDYYYNSGNTVYTLEPGIAAKINEFGVQCGRENDAYVSGSFVELVSVSFLMRGSEPKPAPEDNNYPMDFLEVNAKSDGVTEVVDENGKATITFPKKDDSITYEVPDSVDTNHMTSMQFLQSLSGVKVQLLNANGKVLMEGTDSILATNCNPEVKYIKLVSLADDTVLTLDSIKFNVDPNAYEAIVLNGKFDREDLSMWGTALWGNATITAKTSDTEIGDGIYTYGEITGRESPYHCFAQDVSDRTEHQTGYVFSFWAKLSDDYKGAPPELRTVEFSPYYIDANGNTNYSMYREGAYKQVLEPGVWTRFSGVVNLPSGAKGFIIRVVEQGTNYGQGTCLKGSFAITDVSLSPTSLAEEPNYKWGGGGNRSNTITKEATCEVTYELKDLSIDWASAKANAEKTGMKAEFTNNYDEVRLKLPRTLDMSTCAYIRLNVPAQNVPIALKLYRKGKQVDVSYYNDISGSYLLVPEYDGMIDAIGIMSLSTPNPAGAFMLADLITFGLTQEPAPEEVSNNIVINGDFADEDMSDWSAALWGDGVTITQHTANKPIYGNTYTYATYSRRTSPYQCFAQDITGRVQQNETYTFSFWARLSNDYKGAPENQRVVQFAPYTVDKSGKENYNPRLDGVYSQVLEPGVWTYFEGTYKVTNDNPISKVVIRILEQGTNYGQGDCVKGSYSVAGVQMARYIPDPPSIDEDVPNLKDAMAEVFGDDFITGTAVTLDEMEDVGIEMLVNKHFNAVTIGNELKPDALFNYSNNEHTPLQTITFNGEKLEVPTLYFGRAEEILDTLKTWNESHPDDPVKVRGHVLVWHSQTPEWFFREGYTVKQNADGSENYVTPEVMNLRLEWYIKTVLEHFTGEDSPYKDMFYGWDVVNEAIYNGYRTDKVSSNEPLSQSTHSANSSWWAVYQSNEFIINAFRFANQYAPADVELYYNDYNDSDNKKVVGIVKLLKDVQEAEGTRIDGMGMQGHYNMVSPTIKEIERAIRDYSEVVDKVMYTEFDMKVSGDISREELLQKEYITQAERYHDIYVLLKKLNAEDGINIGGFTVWGTVDKYSWLQSSSSVGGGADGDLTQCPLLFDSNYKVKPSYWALVDYTMVDPNWTEETTEAVTEETKPEIPETPETVDTPESQPEAEPVVETNPVIEEQKKNNPALVVGIAVGAVVLGAGGGAGFYFTKKRKKITK